MYVQSAANIKGCPGGSWLSMRKAAAFVAAINENLQVSFSSQTH
jgi:hypothetical protein